MPAGARPPAAPPRRRRLRRWVLAGVGLAVLAWALSTALALVRITDAAADVQETLDDIRRAMGVDAISDGTARALLDDLHADLTVIDDAVGAPVVLPLRLVPGVGRQIRTAEAISSAGLAGADVGADLLDELSEVLEQPLPRGEQRLAFIDRVRGLLTGARAQLRELDLGTPGPLFPELAEAHRKASAGMDDLDEFLGRAEAFTASVRTVFADADHLLLAANNAEMRSGSGMFLQIGMLEGAAGVVTPGDLTPAEHLTLELGAVRAESSTYEELWGFLHPTVEWRNLAASPRFDVTAELAARMWEARGNERPAGVIAVDPFALRALLRATGPVTVDGVTVGAGDVVEFLLNEQYAYMDDDAGPTVQERRRDRLGGLVGAAFAALEQADLEPLVLFEGLREAIRGRHMMAWSSDPDVQAGWAAMNMSGELEADSLMVSVLNRGANKLDPFLEVAAEVDFDTGGLATSTVTMDVTLRNTVPDGEVRYVAGPWDVVPGVEAYGDYSGLLSLTLPGVARNARIEGVDSLEVAAPDGPVLAIASKFILAQGEQRTFRVTFELPRMADSVVLEPDARPEPVRWKVAEREWSDGEHHRIRVPG